MFKHIYIAIAVCIALIASACGGQGATPTETSTSTSKPTVDLEATIAVQSTQIAQLTHGSELATATAMLDSSMTVAPVTEASEQPTSTPTQVVDTSPTLVPFAYDYSTKSGGDGWIYGQLRLAFHNPSQELAWTRDYKGTVVVETQEGQDYPAIVQLVGPNDQFESIPDYVYKTTPFYQAVFDLSLPGGIAIPPGFAFRTIVYEGQLSPSRPRYAVYFRYAEAAHPLRITFRGIPGWTIPIDNSIKSSAFTFPINGQMTKAMPISVLKDVTISEIPTPASVATMKFDGTCEVATQDSYITRIHFNYTIRNDDKLEVTFSDERGVIHHDFINAYVLASGDGELIVVGPKYTKGNVAPRQTTAGSIEFYSEKIPTVKKPVVAVFYMSKKGYGIDDYLVISLDSCGAWKG